LSLSIQNPRPDIFKFTEKGKRYLEAVDKYQDILAKNVRENLCGRHIKPIFL
jgi:predicted transcriptional regulator